MKFRDVKRAGATVVMTAALAISFGTAAKAEKVANKVAVFTGLDKITGRIITFDVYINETVQFGALRVTPRVCYTRPPTEASQTDAFVDVDVITLNNTIQRIFSGWMFASSPALNAVEHPVYDVWLKDCRQESDIPPPGERGQAQSRQAEPNPEDAETSTGGAPAEGTVPLPPPKPPVPTYDQLSPDEPQDGTELDPNVDIED
ncbi:hypothetical protein HDIA_1876 [Hartmannibacter diazotrophicus]|uniref:DUF2155 domain-containing protein n=1 Tax=Hartmannibacter diazotrophicus TaxID=1482074 RepID=A0A2C9D514_9HYPH|nr:DUF2155 domain-containing protein [Hartmannibacter diazotrophicus]SON55417.1 hypothetical protein HDIA_1876 [Hartmannibacter diazotrophicus]